MALVSRPLVRCCFQQPRFSNTRHFTHLVTDPAQKVQIYISRSLNPWYNLSVEHFLLQKSPPESVVLFLYSNRPCVVIGRNQNPWLEVNLGLLNRPGLLVRSQEEEKDEGVALVRRRSGGGTVFHDEGNVNFSVICPPASFDRNKHAEMVVRALRSLDVKTARVNERHDIVMNAEDEPKGETYKISGSAYKLTRLRSLHHGTCLLSSPNIDRIGQFLRSPAAPYITAQGVESVRSKIRNVGIDNRLFEEAVITEFGNMYEHVHVETVYDKGIEREDPSIAKGYVEIIEDQWTYGQTPRFVFSTRENEKTEKQPPELPQHLSRQFGVFIEARHGKIVTGDIEGISTSDPLSDIDIHKIKDWRAYRNGPEGDWLNKMFGLRPSEDRQ